MRRFATLLLLLATLGLPAGAEESRCSETGSDYSTALCLYHGRDYKAAEEIFAQIAARGEHDPVTIRAEYFLARCRMMQQKYSEASEGLIRIHSLDPAFYREWACDFLLGECRRALGLG
jgi:TolA-binding protein